MGSVQRESFPARHRGEERQSTLWGARLKSEEEAERAKQAAIRAEGFRRGLWRKAGFFRRRRGGRLKAGAGFRLGRVLRNRAKAAPGVGEERIVSESARPGNGRFPMLGNKRRVSAASLSKQAFGNPELNQEGG